jgi:ribosome-binding factor A
MTRRTQQMGEFLREEVVDIIRSEIDDPRLGFWTVTRVEVLPDLRSARIYVSVLGTDGERKETITALRGAAGFIRGHLKPRMRTRIIPDLDFRDDRSMEHAEEIDRTLKALRGEKGGEGGASASGLRGERTMVRTEHSSVHSPLERSDPPSPPLPASEKKA